MRNARFTGWGAAALAAVLVTTAAPAVALPLDESATNVTPAPTESAAPEQTSAPEPTASASAEPSEAPEPAASETPANEAAPLAKRAERSERVAAAAVAGFGDVAVTLFEDRYADGIYDASKQARNGEFDRLGNSARLLTADGLWHEGNDDDKDGVIRFEDMPVGVAQVHLTHPNPYIDTVFYDVTGAASAANITALPNGSYQGTPTAYATVTIDEDGESRLIGMSGLKVAAEITGADGSPAAGVGVEFSSAGTWYPATGWRPGSYEAFRTTPSGSVVHLPGPLGMRLTAPAGYRVDEVTAISASGNTTDFIPVTERDGAYWVASTDASSYSANPTFIVTLEELPTADLVVTEFEDQYADGIYDTTKVAANGRVDTKRDLGPRIRQADGTWLQAVEDAEGDFVFADLPIGPYQVEFLDPNSYISVAFFDATDATSADDIERLPQGGSTGSPTGIASVDLDEDGAELTVGMTALRAVAEVEYEDGTPVTDAEVELGSAGDWYPATSYGYAGYEGTYEAFDAGSNYVRHLPDELGVRVTAPAGYEIATVTARANDYFAAPIIDVTERDGSYWIDSADASSYSSNPTFTVTLEELPTASVDVTYFADVELDGTYQADADTLIKEMQVYLHDSAGEWWATTAGPGGEYSFSGVAPGAATIYARIPEVPDGTVVPEFPELELPDALLSLWDATDVESYRDTVRADTDTISFEGTLINPDGTTEPIAVTDALVGLVDADLEAPQAETRAASQQVLIGGAFVFQAAAVVGPTGDPVEGVEVEFLSNAEQVDGTESDEVPGLFIATEDDDETALFGTAEYGIAPTAPEGYEVVAVTAVSMLDEKVLDVTGGPAAVPAPGAMALFAAGDEYRVDPTQLTGPANGVVWAVLVAPIELPPVDPGTLPGTDVDPGAGLPAAGPAAAPRVLPATGSDMDPLVLMLGAGLLIAAGLGTRLVVRRRNS